MRAHYLPEEVSKLDLYRAIDICSEKTVKQIIKGINWLFKPEINYVTDF